MITHLIPQLGYLSLVIALGLALMLAIFPMWGAHRGNVQLMNSATTLALGVFFFTLLAFLALVYAFVVNDFTVAYVAANSNSLLPIRYRVTAVWGGHEGSFLLWVFIFSVWMAAVALRSQAIPLIIRARVLGVMGLLSIGFYLFILLLSDPFESLLPYFPVDGRDLNPLLQDVGMIIHPPLLYMGYVGLSVSFAFAIAALLTGKLDSTWAKWSRPWTVAAWTFLTLGITVGSWWAYYELGWGGWWFWDPVENASLMPWLIATALIHSFAVTEKRGIFKSWTVLLAITGFSLSLVGTFLVRSGIVVSVHAFASDPSRGLFILGFLFFVISCSLVLYAVKATHMKSYVKYTMFSREVFLWGNNIILVLATIVVLLGTFLPLVHKELGMGSISIGAPFFSEIFSYLLLPFALLLGVTPLMRWKQNKLVTLKKTVVVMLTASIAIGFLWVSLTRSVMDNMAALGVILAIWVMIATIQSVVSRANNSKLGWGALAKMTGSEWSMVFGHLGFAVAVVGMSLTSAYSVEKDVRLATGDSIVLAGYDFHLNEVTPIKAENYSGDAAIVEVTYDGEFVAKMIAEKRFYTVQKSVMTEAAVDAGLTRDLFVALGEQFNDGSWALRIYHKPFIRWIWFGGLFMALGGICAMSDRRYRAKRKALIGQPLVDDGLLADGTSPNATARTQS
ncbi:MAG: cytochrome c-type biogenesis protein CcmF [Phenylobacterium sp.]|jgi:cytochrome c-type biogenesis protein CcmF